MKSRATFTWQILLDVTGGHCVAHHRAFDEAPVDTDTRTFEKDSFFIPLTGANFDGNTFIEQAYEKGAAGSFVASSYLASNPQLKRFPNLIAVESPLNAYLALAEAHRQRSDAKVVAITGSSGKTTTKEMLFTLLSSVLPGRVQKSEKNFNNEVGVALTVLNMAPDTAVLIVEMGMRGQGQIAVLSRCAHPDIAVITNVGPAHIGLLGSLDAIAGAKSEIFEGMDKQTGLGIVNGDDPLLLQVANRSWDGRLETFSLHEVDEIHTKPDGGLVFNYEDLTFALALPGSHNVMNALAGIKVAEALGLPLKKLTKALESFEAGGGRWTKTPVEGADQLWVINDAYNANPASMKVALAAFMDSHFPGLKKVAVIGGMAELGEFSHHYHQEIGDWLAEKGGLDGLIVIGDEARPLANPTLAQKIPVFALDSNTEVPPLILQHWPDHTIFLLKASRAFQLEQIPQLLQAAMGTEVRHVVS